MDTYVNLAMANLANHRLAESEGKQELAEHYWHLAISFLAKSEANPKLTTTKSKEIVKESLEYMSFYQDLIAL